MTSPSGDIPQDMRDLIIRLDEKCQNGFSNVLARLDGMDRRADGHEDRLRKLENDTADRPQYKKRFAELELAVGQHDDVLLQIKTTTANFKILVIALWAIFGAGVLTIGGKLSGIL